MDSILFKIFVVNIKMSKSSSIQQEQIKIKEESITEENIQENSIFSNESNLHSREVIYRA